jgi:hypothetical protein
MVIDASPSATAVGAAKNTAAAASAIFMTDGDPQ